MTESERSFDDLVVRGRVVFPEGERPDTAARLVVRIEDTSRADAPARTIAQHVSEDVRLPQGGHEVPFEIHLPAGSIDPKGRYSLRVHVDVTGTGSVTSGDFVSVASHPLDQPDHSVPVRRV